MSSFPTLPLKACYNPEFPGALHNLKVVPSLTALLLEQSLRETPCSCLHCCCEEHIRQPRVEPAEFQTVQGSTSLERMQLVMIRTEGLSPAGPSLFDFRGSDWTLFSVPAQSMAIQLILPHCSPGSSQKGA